MQQEAIDVGMFKLRGFTNVTMTVSKGSPNVLTAQEAMNKFSVEKVSLGF